MARVCIVGAHPDTRLDVPWDDESWEIWLFNEAPGLDWTRRFDASFQMHEPAIWRNAANRNDPHHHDWLQQTHDKPVYMQERYPDVPDSIPYPLDAVCDALLPGLDKAGSRVKFFTSSAAYAIALAVYLGYSEIWVIGVEMSTHTEYFAQRDCVFFWLGIALGRGVRVRISRRSSLFTDPLYGYDGGIVIGKQEFEAAHHRYSEQAQKLQEAAQQAAGAVNVLMEIMSQERDPARIDNLAKRYMQAQEAEREAIFKAGQVIGAARENERYMARCDALTRAAGGEKSAEVLRAQMPALMAEAE